MFPTSPTKFARVQRHLDAGNLVAAEVLLAGVLRDAPVEPAAHWYMASVQQGQGRFRRAVAHARMALGHVEGRPPSQALCVARVLLSTGQYEDAHALLSRLPMAEMSAGERREAAEQSLAMGCARTALAWLDGIAADAAPGVALTRADALRAAGATDAAREAYSRAAALDPLDPHPLFGLACLGGSGAGARIDRLRGLHRRVEASGWGAAYPWEVLHYAAFAELDRLGDARAAWPALDAGMRSRRRRCTYDDAADDAMFDRLADVLDAWEPAHARADAASRPLFVVGLPGAGGALLEDLLARHPDIAACGELNDLRMAYRYAADYYRPGVLDDAGAVRMAGVDPAAIGCDYLNRTAWRTGDERWFVDRLPGNALLLPVALAGLPGTRVVHVRRDAMDVAFADLRELFAPTWYEYSYALEDAGRYVRRFRRYMSLVEAWAGDRVITVDREALVRAPDATVRGLLARLGLAPPPHAEEADPHAAPVAEAFRTERTRAEAGVWRAYAAHLAPLQRALAGDR